MKNNNQKYLISVIFNDKNKFNVNEKVSHPSLKGDIPNKTKQYSKDDSLDISKTNSTRINTTSENDSLSSTK